MKNSLLQDNKIVVDSLLQSLQPFTSGLKRRLAPLPVNLSFYPVAKNLRFIATQVAKNSRSGRRSVVSEHPRDGEEMFVQQSLGWQSWKPWVWFPDSPSNKRGIESMLASSAWDISPHLNRRDFVQEGEMQILMKFVDHLSSLNAIFKIEPTLLAEIREKVPVENQLWSSIACHIRRGDTQSKNSDWNQPGRTDQFGLVMYAEKCKDAGYATGLNNLFVITDSDDSVEQLASLLPEFTVKQNSFDKDLFFRQPDGQKINIEEYVRLNPDLAAFYRSTTIADLWAVSQCQAFVGPLDTSEMSRTAYYLQIARTNLLTPCFAVGNNLKLSNASFSDLT
jgi:hypothetical protein